ncbi:MBL fold metallo-hydrolase [Paracraurococcus lichenis]|uniref:MBL fold metallo-hydrolase n=1 Tax=Paracraurococcus lichenis TaxID=3064888 RepID=A0ABT9ED47_9PROT|nr:MBL fold metallo-hydrolase [Paracraurococcus sp. LOR1-02]MDO9714138.1 MBL fold metallo-hydrolase [Paracraurococcus sp. LOR1-02]
MVLALGLVAGTWVQAHAQERNSGPFRHQAACSSYKPAAVGGPVLPSRIPGLTLRWLGTSNYEVAYKGKVVLLDTYYDRGPRNRSIGFTPDQVTRADAILIGHAHFDHISDAVSIAGRTGAVVAGAAISADYLRSQGLPEGQILAVGNGSQFQLSDDITVDVALARHSTLSADVLKDAGQIYTDTSGTPTAEETAAEAAIRARGSSDPNIITEGTLAYVLTFDTGFRLLWLDSAGHVTPGDEALIARLGRIDAAIIAYQGNPIAAVQVPVTNALVQLFKPTIYLPAHHDEIAGVFFNLGLEPLFEAIHAELPTTRTLNPLYRAPICLDLTRPDGGLSLSYPVGP